MSKHNFHRGIMSLTAMMMAAGLTIPAGAALPVLANEENGVKQGTIAAMNIKGEGVSVKAYPIVQGTYKNVTGSNGTAVVLLDYVQTKIGGYELKNIQEPTETEITEIARAIRNGEGNIPTEITMTKDNGSGAYTADVDPGEYIVLVSNSGATIYNPAVVSVNVQDANVVDTADPDNGTVNFEGFFGFPGKVYMKSSRTGFTKTVSEGNSTAAGGGSKGITAAAGAPLTFTLSNMTFPDYSDEYTNLQFRISDSLEAGKFSGIAGLKVIVDGREVPAGTETEGNAAYTVSYDGETAEKSSGFTVAFTENYIREHPEQTVEITYQSSLLADGADNNFAVNMNQATLEYSNDPASAESHDIQKASTYQYTFGIDTDIDAEASDPEDRVETHEINKVNQERSAGENYTSAALTNGKKGATSTFKSLHPVKDAEFGLYVNKEAAGTPLATATSDENGHVSFTGLDEGTYYLKETAAPDKYTRNDQIFAVTIRADLDPESGVLKSYSVTTQRLDENGNPADEVGSATYTCKTTVNEDGSLTKGKVDTSQITPAEILNISIPTLPNSGGEGVYGFILAAAAMSGGLVVWEIVSRKKGKRF